MSPRVLLVEPDATLRGRLRRKAGSFGHVDDDADFGQARSHLLSSPYDWVVSNIRLDKYNGLHLVHLVAAARLPARLLVYADQRDVGLAREAQRAGAFYESRDCVHRALAAYFQGTLPPRDRRNAEIRDRRSLFRGGRRCTDWTEAEIPEE
jgi:ActR/RegA family two-component response regulator